MIQKAITTDIRSSCSRHLMNYVVRIIKLSTDCLSCIICFYSASEITTVNVLVKCLVSYRQ